LGGPRQAVDGGRGDFYHRGSGNFNGCRDLGGGKNEMGVLVVVLGSSAVLSAFLLFAVAMEKRERERERRSDKPQ
jgi:hypothetical protein